MPVISQSTWDRFTQEEKQEIREIYKATKKEEHRSGPERNAVLSLMVNRYESLFGIHNLQPQPLTYDDVARELFEKSGLITYGVGEGGVIFYFNWSSRYDYIKSNQPNLCTSRKQAEKLLAINKLLNVAKFFNGDWKPDWEDEDNDFYCLAIDPWDKDVIVTEVNKQRVSTEIVYFRTEELAQQAIQILGENTVRLALTTEY